VHETVVDTSLVFPHAKGRPYKRALKTLMSEYLAKIIQENGNSIQIIIGFIQNFFVYFLAEGHDSIEDAISCMELMLWKVKQDLKSSSSTR
jgi:RNA exonuclease 1